MTLALGIDGGGTKTHALVVSDAGDLRGFATNGPSNWEGVGLRGARDAIADAIARALAQAGGTLAELSASAFGLAGLDWESDTPRLRSVIDQLGLPCPYTLVNDSFVALRAGTDGACGVVLIAGTGSVAAGRNAAGRTFRTLGEGPMLGDVGAASDVSDAAVRAVANAYTGRGPATLLTEELCTLAGCRSPAEFLEQYSRGIEPAARNAAPAVVRASEEGDEVARGIVRWAGTALGESAVLVARQLDLLEERFDVVLSGGLFRAGSLLLTEALEAALRPQAPGARLLPLQTPPVVGAALLALDALDVRVPASERRALDQAAATAVRERPWMQRGGAPAPP
jgi:N-acetylglucosamine kinase-like BadF-type ATPase